MKINTIHSFIGILFISTAYGGAIIELRLKTADVHDAGCDCDLEVAIETPNVKFSKRNLLKAKINNFQGLCVTNKLDSSRNDFETGHLDSYTGGVLGECNGFNAGAEVDGWEMIIFHSGITNTELWNKICF